MPAAVKRRTGISKDTAAKLAQMWLSQRPRAERRKAAGASSEKKAANAEKLAAERRVARGGEPQEGQNKEPLARGSGAEELKRNAWHTVVVRDNGRGGTAVEVLDRIAGRSLTFETSVPLEELRVRRADLGIYGEGVRFEDRGREMVFYTFENDDETPAERAIFYLLARMGGADEYDAVNFVNRVWSNVFTFVHGLFLSHMYGVWDEEEKAKVLNVFARIAKLYVDSAPPEGKEPRVYDTEKELLKYGIDVRDVGKHGYVKALDEKRTVIVGKYLGYYVPFVAKVPLEELKKVERWYIWGEGEPGLGEVRDLGDALVYNKRSTDYAIAYALARHGGATQTQAWSLHQSPIASDFADLFLGMLYWCKIAQGNCDKVVNTFAKMAKILASEVVPQQPLPRR